MHAARRHIKRARTATRLLTPALDPKRRSEANAALRAAAQALSADRDADVIASLAKRLARECPQPARSAFRAVAAWAEAEPRRGDVENADALAALAQARRLVEGPVPTSVEARLIADEIARIYEKGRKAMRRARDDSDVEALHDWRKRVKDRWHTARLMNRVWPEGARSRIRKLGALGDLLGSERDLALLAEALEILQPQTGDHAGRDAERIVESRRKALRRKVFVRGETLYRQSGKEFAELWEGWPKPLAED